MSLWNKRDWTPQLLGEVEKPFDSNNHLFEIKFDGIRAVIFVSKDKVIIKNRHNEDITFRYPELQNIKELVEENCIFDGEIIFFENGLPSFSKLQERAHLKNKTKIELKVKSEPVIFVCFDILYKGKDLINLPLIKRKKILGFFQDNDYFLKTKYVINNGIKLFNIVKDKSLEGIVAKEVDSLYIPNSREKSWLKIKNFCEEEFFIGGYIDKNKNVVSLVLGEKKNNKLHYVGNVVLAKKYELYKKIIKEKELEKTPFKNFESLNVKYIKPKHKIKIKYMERTKNNHLRQPFISK